MSMQDGQGLNDLIQKELHGIDSTQIQDSCQSLEERILAMLGSSEARNAQEPPEEEEQGDDNEKHQNLKKALKGAMETGGFSLRGGVLGNMWSRDLQRDDALRNNYEKCKATQISAIFVKHGVPTSGIQCSRPRKRRPS